MCSYKYLEFKIYKIYKNMNIPIIENKNLELNILLNYIKIEKGRVFRKAVLSDFIKDTSKKILEISPSINSEKAKNYRIQGEYGERKFIKP